MPNNNLLLKNLIDFGLSEKEAKIYLSLLELEIGTVQEVAKKAGINRSSSYVILESLKKKGLVNISVDQKIQQYIAIPPEILLQTAKEKTNKQIEIRDRIDDILPDLKALYKGTKKKPKVRVFEGKQGLINAMEETLSSKNKLVKFSSSCEKLLSIIPEYLAEYGKKRYALGIKLKVIYPLCKAAETIISLYPKLYEVVLIPKNKYPFSADIAIFDDKIGYLSIEKNTFTTIIIENKEIAEVMEGLFDFAYEEARRISKRAESVD